MLHYIVIISQLFYVADDHLCKCHPCFHEEGAPEEDAEQEQEDNNEGKQQGEIVITISYCNCNFYAFYLNS